MGSKELVVRPCADEVVVTSSTRRLEDEVVAWQSRTAEQVALDDARTEAAHAHYLEILESLGRGPAVPATVGAMAVEHADVNQLPLQQELSCDIAA